MKPKLLLALVLSLTLGIAGVANGALITGRLIQRDTDLRDGWIIFQLVTSIISRSFGAL